MDFVKLYGNRKIGPESWVLTRLNFSRRFFNRKQTNVSFFSGQNNNFFRMKKQWTKYERKGKNHISRWPPDRPAIIQVLNS